MEGGEWNAHLSERFGRKKRDKKQDKKQDKEKFKKVELISPPASSDLLRQYHEAIKAPVDVDAAAWLSAPETPDSKEMLTEPGENEIVVGTAVSERVSNRVSEGDLWQDKDEYLAAQYGFLRENAIRPLRDAVKTMREHPDATEDNLPTKGELSIYEQVHLKALIACKSHGIAHRVSFSKRRIGRKIRWEQSSRLSTGSAVALSPTKDMFKTQCIFAVVAARPVSGLESSPPTIDLLFDPKDMIIDPSQEWVMIQPRSGLYEADRHTMSALQAMRKERGSVIVESVINVEQGSLPPPYAMHMPVRDLSIVSKSVEHQNELKKVDIMSAWPKTIEESVLDDSQLEALRTILTRRLAIVQGPPGTGKTFVSAMALRILLQKRGEDDPPIVVACQTNHALDQLLRHVHGFEEDAPFVRLGGQSKDEEIIKPRTLFNLRENMPMPNIRGSLDFPTFNQFRQLELQLVNLLKPFDIGRHVPGLDIFKEYGILTGEQAEKLTSGAGSWGIRGSTTVTNPLEKWLGDKQMVSTNIKVDSDSEDKGTEWEQLNEEELDDDEAQRGGNIDDTFEILNGAMYEIKEECTGKKPPLGTPKTKLEQMAQEKDLWKVQEKFRGGVYRIFSERLKNAITAELRRIAKAFKEQSIKRKYGKWERDALILKKMKVIGLTTTGLNKYRALIHSIQPSILLIEEAAETLEAPVIAGCVPSIEHLILVGDQKQLRPRCTVNELGTQPWNWDVSMFERVIEQKMAFSMLCRQRRMKPEIRQLIAPIYEDRLEDHASVLEYSDVPGMGGCNSFFFDHRFHEVQDAQKSWSNREEARLIVAFAAYLVNTGVDASKITVLTFYNGQRKELLRAAGSDSPLRGQKLQVATVDGFQGEENDVILLSLTRNNAANKIGFLAVQNRVCVALSRARKGLYIFGNADMVELDPTWNHVVTVMKGGVGATNTSVDDGWGDDGWGVQEEPVAEPVKEPVKESECRLGDRLPLTCPVHGTKLFVKKADDWPECQLTLSCGEPCPTRGADHRHTCCNACSDAWMVMRAQAWMPDFRPRVVPFAGRKQNGSNTPSVVPSPPAPAPPIDADAAPGVSRPASPTSTAPLVPLSPASPSKPATTTTTTTTTPAWSAESTEDDDLARLRDHPVMGATPSQPTETTSTWFLDSTDEEDLARLRGYRVMAPETAF